MNTVQARHQAIRQFMAWIGAQDRIYAVELLDQSQVPQDADVLLMTLARELHAHRPQAIDRELTPLETTALVVTLANGNAVDLTVDPFDTERVAQEVRLLAESRVRGLFATVQAALASAIVQIGGATAFGIPSYLSAEVRDPNRAASPHNLDEVELIAEANHGWFVRRATNLGFVLFRTNDK